MRICLSLMLLSLLLLPASAEDAKEKITTRLQEAFNQAEATAKARKHAQFSTVHLASVMFDDNQVGGLQVQPVQTSVLDPYIL
jgi:hypothetical protein